MRTNNGRRGFVGLKVVVFAKLGGPRGDGGRSHLIKSLEYDYKPVDGTKQSKIADLKTFMADCRSIGMRNPAGPWGLIKDILVEGAANNRHREKPVTYTFDGQVLDFNPYATESETEHEANQAPF